MKTSSAFLPGQNAALGNAAKRQNAALLAFRLILALVALLFAACSPVVVTPTPAPPTAALTLTPTLRFSTHTGPVVRATLPPTWTETPTPLPTSTPTATPITPTATATPAPLLADLCPSFTVTRRFTDGHIFGWSESLTLVFGTNLSAVTDPATGKVIPVTVRFLATNPLDGKNLGAQLAGGQVAILELPIYQLPEPGFYTWKAAVYGEGIDEMCVQRGWFVVVRTDGDLANLATATVQAATLRANAAATATTQAAAATDETTILVIQ